jgi:hypothetical protein
MKKYIVLIPLLTSVLLTGCISMASINAKIAPLNKWWESEYEESRFTQRYKFTKADTDSVRKGIVNSVEKVGLTISSSIEDIVASGNPTTMFTNEECESWKRADEEKTKQLSSGLIALTCDPSNKNSTIVATVKLKAYPSGTLIVLDYEILSPKMDAYGIVGPRRPGPAASKAGSSKFWETVSKAISQPIRNATKEDLL